MRELRRRLATNYMRNRVVEDGIREVVECTNVVDQTAIRVKLAVTLAVRALCPHYDKLNINNTEVLATLRFKAQTFFLR